MPRVELVEQTYFGSHAAAIKYCDRKAVEGFQCRLEEKNDRLNGQHYKITVMKYWAA